MGAKYTESQERAIRKYLDKTVSIQLRVTKEERDLIKQKAESENKSLSKYIIDLIRKEL